MNKPKTRRCAACRAGERLPFEHLEKRQIDERGYAAHLPATRCNSCGDEQVPERSKLLFERALTVHLARSGSIGPQGFRWLRRKTTIEAKTLGTLLDVSPGTVSRWENGKKPLERRAIALVAALSLEAAGEKVSMLELLEKLGSNPKSPIRVRLDLSAAQER